MHVCWCTLIANNAQLPPSPSPRSQESHQKAENCLKFVSKLQEPCLELSKAEPKAIPALLPRLLHTVRIISLHSDHYRSRERITALLRKVGWLATLGTGTRLPYIVLRCSVGWWGTGVGCLSRWVVGYWGWLSRWVVGYWGWLSRWVVGYWGWLSCWVVGYWGWLSCWVVGYWYT